jgi:hypothetical protein
LFPSDSVYILLSGESTHYISQSRHPQSERRRQGGRKKA